MSDTNKQNQNVPPIVINSQYIKDLSFEIPHAPEVFGKIRQQPQIKVDVQIKSQKLNDTTHEVVLNVSLNGDVENEKLFILELSYGAAVTLNVPAEHVEPVLGIEIPRLLFPFARNVVTHCLTEGGLPPIMLNPIDFAALYAVRQKKGNA